MPTRRRHPILSSQTLLRLKRMRTPMRAPARHTPTRRILNLAAQQVPAK